ncbi:hypothetical protein ACFX11_036125 [Malus domestica]
MYQLRLRTSDCRWNWRRRSGRGFCSGRPAEGRKGCSFWAPRKTKKEGKCDFNLRKQDGVSVSVHDAQISQLNSGDGRESPSHCPPPPLLDVSKELRLSACSFVLMLF